MIHIDPQPAPADFVELVQKPGLLFLSENPWPTGKEWKGREYWRRVLHHLYIAYSRTCAYTCHRIAEDTGSRSVEHFEPKSLFPGLAYEWSNYRLVCLRLNARRGTRKILDPFLIKNGTFAISFPSLEVVPGPLCSGDEELAASVRQTCEILRLNDETTCIASRMEYMRLFCFRFCGVGMDFLREQAPLLASELSRQGLDDFLKAREVMSFSDDPERRV